jgi:isoleucyl-tRNA synthetase
VFYDGPPFATGLPHYGHLLAGTIKDIVPRYQTMRGHYVERRFGWDCHGLPIEALAQEALGLSRRARSASGRRRVQRAVPLDGAALRREWRKTVTRMGRWVDFDNDYKTMDPTFMETIWWVFKQLWDQGRVYKAYRIMPYSWKLTTPLSNFEAGSNYKDVQDPRHHRAALDRAGADGGGGPATCSLDHHAVDAAGNLASAPARTSTTSPCATAGRRRLPAGRGAPARTTRRRRTTRCWRRFKGADLAGWTYEPLFPYFAGPAPGAFRVLHDGFVTHRATAPASCTWRRPTARTTSASAAPPGIEPTGRSARRRRRFTAAVPDYAGQFCKDADKAIIKRLKDEGKLVHQTTLVHSYPFCERTDTPLIYRAIEAWYVRVEDLRDRLVRQQRRRALGARATSARKRFGNWLREAKDWNISRNRFWGSCIPVWVAEDGKTRSASAPSPNWRPLRPEGHRPAQAHVDRSSSSATARPTAARRRCSTAGSSPAPCPTRSSTTRSRTASTSRPLPGRLHRRGPRPDPRLVLHADGALGGALRPPAFRNVVVNGLVLAEDGRKMSKRLKNYPDPAHMLDTYGADALRLYMINSPVVRAEDLRFSEEGVKQALRDLLIPLWNAYSFFVTYANVDGWTPARRAAAEPQPARPLDPQLARPL